MIIWNVYIYLYIYSLYKGVEEKFLCYIVDTWHLCCVLFEGVGSQIEQLIDKYIINTMKYTSDQSIAWHSPCRCIIHDYTYRILVSIMRDTWENTLNSRIDKSQKKKEEEEEDWENSVWWDWFRGKLSGSLTRRSIEFHLFVIEFTLVNEKHTQTKKCEEDWFLSVNRRKRTDDGVHSGTTCLHFSKEQQHKKATNTYMFYIRFFVIINRPFQRF